MDYTFHFYNALAETGVFMALDKLLSNSPSPIVVCIGSDLAIGDSLGPITGTLLKKLLPVGSYVYGTLKQPVTAKEVKYLNDFLKRTHPDRKIIAIDAAVGEESDVGLIKITDGGLKPGAGANKKLGKIGDISIMGIVAKKTSLLLSSLNITRLNMIYTMAEVIASSVATLFFERQTRLPA